MRKKTQALPLIYVEPLSVSCGRSVSSLAASSLLVYSHHHQSKIAYSQEACGNESKPKTPEIAR